jgi:cell division protein FtsQ
MAAIVRADARGESRGRSKPSRPSQQTRSRAVPTAAYAPAKIRAAQGIGLKPGWALAAAAAVACVGLVAAAATGDRLERASAAVGSGVAGKLALLGFKLTSVYVKGATPEASADILKASGLYSQEPILGVDLEGLRQRLQTVGWVKGVKVVRLLPDTLVITVDERATAAVWQHNGRTYVVDDKGQVIREADPGRFADLPLVVGAGANEAAPEILPLVKARPRLMQRLEALVRVDERRWDLRLKDGALIQLPADGQEAALIQLDQLDQKARILELGFARIDLRDPDMVAVRPKDGGAAIAPQPPAQGA